MSNRALYALLSLIVLLAFGCESADPAAPRSDVSQPPGTGPGLLRIRFSGLPREARPRVTVTGPNGFVAHVDRDLDLEVAPGDYELSAGAAGGDGRIPFYAPEPATETIAVAASEGRSAEIRYAPLETKLKPDVREVSAETGALLATATAAPDGTTTLVFTQATSETSSWKAGDVVLFKPTKAAPSGHMGRIVSTDGLTVVTKPASLEDVYEQGGFHIEKTLTLQDNPIFFPGQAFTTRLGICPQISGTYRLYSGPASTDLELSGDICLGPAHDDQPSLVFDYWITVIPAGQHAYFKVDDLYSLKLTGRVGAGLGGAIEFSLGRWQFPGFSVGPFYFVPEFDFRVFASAQAAAGFYGGADFSVSFNTGFGYDSNENPSTRTWGERSDKRKAIWPTPYLGATLSLEVGPQINLLLDGLAGPYVGVRGLIRYDVVPQRDPLWKLEGGMRVDTGVATSSVFNKTFRVPIWDDLYLIASSNDTPEYGALTMAVPDAGSTGDIAFGPDGKIYLASGNQVRAFGLPEPTKIGSLIGPLWSFTADGPVVHVARAPNGTIFATDFGSNIYAISSAGTLLWKKPATLARGLAVGDTHVYTMTYTTQAQLEAFAFADGASWSVPLGTNHRGVAVSKDGRTVYAVGEELNAIDTATHAVIWKLGGVTSAVPPAIGDDGVIYTLDVNGAPRATNPNGTNKWVGAEAFSDAYYGLSVGPNGSIYVCAIEGLGDGGLRGYDANGKLKFRVKIPQSRSLCRTAPTVGADDRIYLSTLFNLSVFDPDGTLAWQAPFDVNANAAPVLLPSKEVLVAGTQDLRMFYSGTTLPPNNWPRAGGDNAGTGRKQ
jgi:sugar lactone lactonase YvrE